MADSKITALTALTAADPANDMIPIVDVSDTPPASGNTKRISINNILACSPSATLASATITGDLTVRTNNLAVTSTGVGIGTASPAYIADVSVATTDGLRVKNTLATSAYFNRFHISNDTGINFIGYGASYAGGTILGLGANSNSIFSDAAAPFGITTTVNQPLVFGINGSTAMTLNSTGLGIGQSPTANLDVQGNASTGANNSITGAITRMRDIYTRFRSNSAGISGDLYAAQLFGGGNAAFEIYSMTSYPLVFGTAATERMRIDSTGQLLLGTATNSGVVDTAMVMDKSSGSGFVGNVYRMGGADKGYSYLSSASASMLYETVTGYVIRMVSATNGVYLANGGTSWLTISDERNKDIIEPISNAVAKVGSLRSVIGKFKSETEGTRRSFLIAQDVQAVLPEAVDSTNPNELAVSYTDVIPLLVAAIKELTAEVNALKKA